MKILVFPFLSSLIPHVCDEETGGSGAFDSFFHSIMPYECDEGAGGGGCLLDGGGGGCWWDCTRDFV